MNFRFILWVALFCSIYCMSFVAAANDSLVSVRALLVPKTESTLSSQISARIIKIQHKNGERFKKNDVLIKFDCSIYNALYKKAKAEYSAAHETKKVNQQMKTLSAIGKLDLAISDAKLNIAAAEKSLALSRLGYCKVKAPFDGRIVKLHVNEYESVADAQKLVDILDDSRLQMKVNVPSSWALKLVKDSAFNVKIDETGKTYPAVVTRTGSKINAVSQTYEIYAEINGEFPELIAGMSGEAIFKFND